MSIIEAISSVFKHYAVFRGRARRREYWYFFLLNSLVSTAVSAIGIQEILGIYVLVMLLPGMAVAVRRMHDTDHSGWFLLVPIYSLILLFTEGTAGNNRFGPDPKAASGAAAAIVSSAEAAPAEPKHIPAPASSAAVSGRTAAGKTCPSCGAVNAATASFCTSCGSPLAGTVHSSFSHTPAAKPAAEKKPSDDYWQTPTDF